MPLYFLKPVVWNTKDYRKPSGEKVTSGYPKDHGFGHEEWNNAESSTIIEEGEPKRVFHTEKFGNQPLDDFAGDIFVFMIASNEGRQYLVGVAGGATSLLSDEHKQKRLEYSRMVAGGKERWTETWSVPTVKTCYNNDMQKFREHWNDELQWTANWVCPAELFYWLEKPMLLNPIEISGKKFLIKMFSSYQEISRVTAASIAGQIKSIKESSSLDNIKARLAAEDSDLATDIAKIKSTPKTKPTIREALIQARLGQGKFRQDLIDIWGGVCAATGCEVQQILRASHVVPWSECSNKERLDPNNGLLLAANLDALFDRSLISFMDTGEMLISSTIPVNQREILGLPVRLRRDPSPELRRYLAKHRATLVP